VVVLTINTVGDERFVRGFNRYAQEVQDWRPAFEQIYDNFLDIERRNFRAQGYPHPWKQLSPEYRQWKAVHYPGKPILQRTGRLMRSLTAKRQAGAQDTVKDIRKLRAEFGTQVPYARAHQQGHPPRNLPARPVVQLTERNKVFWSRIIQEWAYQKVKKA
jgi:phage gpG-like protein